MNKTILSLTALFLSCSSIAGVDIVRYLVAVQPYNKTTQQFDTERTVKRTCEKDEIRDSVQFAYQELKRKKTQLNLFHFFALKGFDPDDQCEEPEKEYTEIVKKLGIKIIITQLKKSPNIRRGVLDL